MHVTMNTIGERISCWQAGLQPSQLLRAGSQQGYCHACDPQPRATATRVTPAMGCWECGLAMAVSILGAAAGEGPPWG